MKLASGANISLAFLHSGGTVKTEGWEMEVFMFANAATFTKVAAQTPTCNIKVYNKGPFSVNYYT